MRILFTSLLLIIGLAMAKAQVPVNVPTNGLIGYWPLDSNVLNAFSTNHPGSFNLTVPAMNRFGIAGKALYFNGINAYAALPSSVMATVTTNNFSVSVWVSPDTVPIRSGGTEILGDRTTATWNYRCSIGYGSNAPNYAPDSAYFECIMSGGARKVHATFPTVEQWTHYVYVHSAELGGTIRAYANGQLINTLTGVGWTTGNRPINIGRSLYPSAPSGGNYFVKGRIDDIGFWNRALTATEVAALYNPCLQNPPNAPLDRSVALGDSVHLSVGSTISGLQYQWQVSNTSGFTNLSNNATYSGVNSAQLVIQAVTNQLQGLQYRCVVGDTNCSVTTQSATLTVICPQQISQEPLSTTQTVASNASFQLVPTNGSATFQWQLFQGGNFQNLSNFGQFSGVNTATLLVQSLSFSNNGQLFRCIVGGLNCDDTSNVVQLTVQCLPIITVDPAPTSAFSGGNAIFSLQSGGTGSGFQWQRRLSGGSFVNVSNSGQYSGANSNQLQIQALTLQNNQEEYRCLVSNLGCTDTSAIALLSVSCANQITQQPRDTLVRIGANVRFEVNFSPSITYKWYRISGINLLQLSDNSQTLGTNTQSLQLLNVQLSDHNTAYVCELVQGECADTSSFAILRVDNAASVHEQSQHTLLLYPNPAHEQLIIQRPQQQLMSPLRIYDSLGRLCFESTSDELELVVDLENWPVGAYFAQIGRHRTKFIVKH